MTFQSTVADLFTQSKQNIMTFQSFKRSNVGRLESVLSFPVHLLHLSSLQKFLSLLFLVKLLQKNPLLPHAVVDDGHDGALQQLHCGDEQEEGLREVGHCAAVDEPEGWARGEWH